MKSMTSNPRYCLQCDDGTVLEFATRDLSGEIRGVPYRVQQIRGWHCPACHHVEFAQDDDSALRFSAAIRAAGAQTRGDAQAVRKLARA